MNEYSHPRPFLGDPFDDEPDTEHPSPDGSADVTRMVIERHIHVMQHDASDEWAHVPVTAVFWPGIGENVELGPWSMSADDARRLAYSLTTLADLVTVDGPRGLIHSVDSKEA